MTDPKYDNPLPGPGGRKPGIGTVYVDPRTGETKQVVLGGRDTVLRPGATKKPTPPKQEKAKAKEGKIVSQEEYNAARSLMEVTRDALALARFAESQIGDPVYQGKVYKGVEGRQELKQIVEQLKSFADESFEKFRVVAEPIEKVQTKIDDIDKKLKDTVSEGEKKAGVKPLSPAEKAKLKEEKAKLATKLKVVAPVTTEPAGAEKVVTPAAGEPQQIDLNKVMGPVASRGTGTPAVTTTPKPGVAPTGAKPRTTTTTPGTGAPATTATPAAKAVFDTEIVNERNVALKKSYTNVNDYLTDNGRFAKGSADYKRRAAYVKDQRTQFTNRVSTIGATEATSWLNSAKADYGWIASLYETDASIKKLLDDAVTYKYTPERFLAEYNKTSWYNTTAPKLRQYQQEKNSPEWADKLTDSGNVIRQRATAKGIQLSEATISYLAEESRKWQWTEIELDNSIGAQYVAQVNAAETAATQNTGILTGQTDIRTSTQYQELKGLAGSYLLDNVTEDELSQYTKDILVGTKTKETFKRDMAARAKLRYSSLGDYIDQGYDLKSVTQDYRAAAASTLEVDSGAVDFTSDTYAKAFNYVDPDSGKSRQMNLQEWNSYLRGLPEWQKTENAKEAYTKVALGIAQSFGRRM